MGDLPSLEEARRMIRDLSLPWLRHCHAAGVITASPEASDEDLLALSPHTWLTCGVGSLHALRSHPSPTEGQ
jgi:hypothetical protein